VPRRCCGSYIPDCQGCAFFTGKQLFESSADPRKKGYCERYGKDLLEESRVTGSRVMIEE
jgi:hypothetical protein